MVAGLMLWMNSPYAFAQEPTPRPLNAPTKIALPVSLDSVPKATREAIEKVMQNPTISAIAPVEEFISSGTTYLWLLDNPNRVSLAWQRLNVGAVEIQAAKNGGFNWKDDLGSELTWQTVAKSGEGRIWYAEGKVKPGQLIPTVPVKAVAILRHGIRKNDDGEPMIRHQVEVFLQTDSKAASVVTKMLGPAVPKMAEQGAEQLLLFFSGIARYVDRHPTKAEVLLAEKK